MSPIVRAIVATVGLAALTPALASAQSAVSCGDRVSTTARFTVRFEEGEWRTTPPIETRITDRDRVDVCIEHFNFLRYTLKFDVAEQRSESYGYLAKLWSSILSPSLAGVLAEGAPGTPAADPLLQKLQTLYALSLDTDAAIAAAARSYTATGLTAAQAASLARARGSETTQPKTGIAGQVEVLGRARADLQSFLLNPANTAAFAAIYGERREMYRAITELHAAVSERAEIFLRLSAKAIGIEVKRVGKRQPGTRVTFTVVALDEAGGVTPVDEVGYFVQSTMPLVVHGGVSFSGLRDLAFDKVKRAGTFGEEELFQQQGSTAGSIDYTLFLGWQLYGSNDDVTGDRRQSRVGAAFSLGTDVRSPGRRIFAGPSVLLFSRIVVSGGAVFGKESEGEAAAAEPNIFRLIRERRKTTWFFSISTKVY